MRTLVSILIAVALLVALAGAVVPTYVDENSGRDVILLSSVTDADSRDVLRYDYETTLEDAEGEDVELSTEAKQERIVAIYGAAATHETERVIAPVPEALITPEEDTSLLLYPQSQADGTYAYQAKSLTYVGGQVTLGSLIAFALLLVLRFTVLRTQPDAAVAAA